MRGVPYTIIASRQQALEKGEKSFFTGIPCARGHVAKRYVENGSCYGCVAIAVKKWRNKQRDKKRKERAE